jgi:hypothetical protein
MIPETKSVAELLKRPGDQISRSSYRSGASGIPATVIWAHFKVCLRMIRDAVADLARLVDLV